MTLQRRPVGRGRWIAAISAVVIMAGCVLPWFRAGGSEGIPPLTGNAFDGMGILVVLAALATLALVSLPYAMGDRPVAIDRWWTYALIVGGGAVGLLGRLAGILGVDGGMRLVLPDRGPGLWVTAVGLVGLLYATAELYGARER